MNTSCADAGRNIKLLLEFDGTAYHGWQIQKDLPTVQGELTRAAREGLQDADITITGCGRTDAGVHARRYCANFHTSNELPAANIVRILNARLADDISVLEAEETAEDFNARFSAIAKWYRYTILNTRELHPLQDRYAWHMPRPLNPQAMSAAAAVLTGRHDFTAFSGKGDPDKDPVREIHSLEIIRENDLVRLDVKGPSFLFRMVRIIAGTLADAGTGTITAEDVAAILAARDREKQRAAAPAKGLTLMEVKYG